MHFVTFSVYRHTPVFRNNFLAKTFLENLNFYCDDQKSKLHGYVIMPDHIHLLVEMLDDSCVSDLIRDIKKYFSYKAKNVLLARSGFDRSQFLCDGKFYFWERGFDEVTIASDKMFWTKFNYIHNNPVKANLVDMAEDYVYSSALEYLKDDNIETGEVN